VVREAVRRNENGPSDPDGPSLFELLRISR
jgi:hypothetical protein